MLVELQNWARKHKKELIITGTILGIIGAIAIVVINGKRVRIPITDLTRNINPAATESNLAVNGLDAITHYVAPTAVDLTENVSVNIDGVIKTFPRSEFIRHLHEGWQPSAAKLAQAKKLRIKLNPGETIVNACTVTMRAA